MKYRDDKYIKVLDSAMRMLDYMDRTKTEIKKKLVEKKYNEDMVDEVIAELEDKGFINDISYVSRYVDFSFNKGKGLFRIKAELKQKGVDAYDIEDGIFEFEESLDLGLKEYEEHICKEIFSMEVGKKKEISIKERNRISRKLNNRGFSFDTIKKTMSNIKVNRE